MRFCPKTDWLKNHLEIKNGYNFQERTAFSIDIIKCDIKKDSTCKRIEAIDKVLKLVYFTMYTL